MSRPGRASVVPLTTCRRPPRCRVATSSSHTPAKCSKPGTGSSESRPRSHLTDTERAAPKETRPRLTCSSRTARTRPCRYEPTAPSATANRERGHDRKPSRDPYARGPEGQLAPQPPAWSILVRVRACARAGSQAALFCVRERDRVLRPDRRARPCRTTGHLAARRTDARDRPGGHARPLRE